MKIRSGFVSNSSSSSFFLATKKDLTETIKDLSLEDGHPLKQFVDRLLIEGIEGNVQDVIKNKKEYMVFEDYNEEEYDKYVYGECKKYIESPEYTVYVGSFSNDTSNPIERALCEMDLNFENEDVCMIHDGRY